MSKPRTLEFYLGVARLLYDSDSPAVRFIEAKIAKSPNGKDEAVLTDERQMLHLLQKLGSHR